MAQTFFGNTFIQMLSSLCHHHYGPFSDIIVVSEGAWYPQLSSQPHPVLSSLCLLGLPVLGVWCEQTMQPSGPVNAPFPQHNALQDASVVGIKASFLWGLKIPFFGYTMLFTHSSGPGPGFPSTLWLLGLFLWMSIAEFVCRHVFSFL